MTGGYDYFEQMLAVVSAHTAQPDIFPLAWLTSFGVIPMQTDGP